MVTSSNLGVSNEIWVKQIMHRFCVYNQSLMRQGIDSLAQWLEYRISYRKVLGSNPEGFESFILAMSLFLYFSLLRL